MLGSIGGALYGFMNGQFGLYSSSMKDDPNFLLAGAPWPYDESVISKSYSSNADINSLLPGAGACITTVNEYPELTTQYLDYGYSEEGKILHNFGKEGETFTLVNGKPTYTDLILNLTFVEIGPKTDKILQKHV